MVPGCQLMPGRDGKVGGASESHKYPGPRSQDMPFGGPDTMAMA